MCRFPAGLLNVARSPFVDVGDIGTENGILHLRELAIPHRQGTHHRKVDPPLAVDADGKRREKWNSVPSAQEHSQDVAGPDLVGAEVRIEVKRNAGFHRSVLLLDRALLFLEERPKADSMLTAAGSTPKRNQQNWVDECNGASRAPPSTYAGKPWMNSHAGSFSRKLDCAVWHRLPAGGLRQGQSNVAAAAATRDSSISTKPYRNVQ